MSKVLGGIWVRTRICGCGECRFKPLEEVCPKANDKGAVQLWASDFSKNIVDNPEEDGPEPKEEKFVATDVNFKNKGQESYTPVHVNG